MAGNDIESWVAEAKLSGGSGRPFFMLRNKFYRGMSEGGIEDAIKELAEENDLDLRIVDGHSQSSKVDRVAILRCHRM